MFRIGWKTLLTAFGIFFGFGRLILDFVGYSTFFEDFAGLQEKARPLADALGTVPALPFYGLCVALILVGISLHVSPERWRKIRSGVGKALHLPQPEQPEPDLVSIRTAATLMYERASPRLREWATTIMSIDADIDNTAADPGAYFVEVVKSLAAHSHLVILGRRAPDLVLEEIPADYFENTTMLEGNGIRLASTNRIEWHDAQVSRSAALARVADYERDDFRQGLYRKKA